MKKRESIFLKICNETYHIADIVLDFTKDDESIYYVLKEKTTNQLGKDLNTGKIAGCLDHFSFHSDGNVHSKYKQFNRSKNKTNTPSLYKEIGKLPDGLFPKNHKLISPLIIDSIFKNCEEWPLLPTKDSKTAWKFDSLTELSVLIFLMDSNTNHIQLLHQKGLGCLKIHEVALRIPFLHNYDVVVCITPFTIPEVFPESLPNFGLYCERNFCQNFSRQIVCDPPPLAFEHLCYGRSIILPNEK
jgi:hypothetical protein